MHVALIVPSYADIYGSYQHLYRKGFVNPPLQLAYLAAALEQKGHKATIIDGEAAQLTIQQIIDQVTKLAPQLIGLSATSIDFDRCVKLSRAIKGVLPKVPIVVGGTHVNIFREQVLEENPEFDLACLGDGEDLIVELAAAIEGDSQSGLDTIPGLVHRQDGQVTRNPDRPLEMHIDRYPFPARHLLDNLAYYRSVPKRGYLTTAAFMSSRGCPFNCVYCAVKKIHGGTRVRLRSASNVLDELEHITKNMGITHVAFNDDCLTLDRQRILDICQGIKQRGLSFTWEGLSRADMVDLELLQTMRRAGFVRMSLGIESGNPQILKVIQKNETLEQISEAFRMARAADIVTRGSVILGNPYETKSTVWDTLRFITKLKGLDQAVINILQPYPGTKVRDMVLSGEGGSRLIGSSDRFDDLQRFGTSRVEVNDLTSHDLVRLQKVGFALFYLRPRIILRNLKLAGWRGFYQDATGFARSLLGI